MTKDKINHATDNIISDNEHSEIIIGLVGSVGTDMEPIRRCVDDRLKAFKYSTEYIHISKEIITLLQDVPETDDNFTRIDTLMTEGNILRKESEDNAILARLAVALINNKRCSINSADRKVKQPRPKTAYIISSLKHPDEIKLLRDIYSNGFYLIGIHVDEERRRAYLIKNKSISENNAATLIERDSEEKDKWGQHTRDTFELSDFFISYRGTMDVVEHDLERMFDLLFGHPYITPTFDEYAMFMAFSAALRSADLSRQVGAVLTKQRNIISTGANDVPTVGGGLYWPEQSDEGIKDVPNGRDYTKGFDSNVRERLSIIDDILDNLNDRDKKKFKPILESSKLKYITEYGRVVHAEMEAILACARSNISTENGVLYCTTFPCHNCAKHIIASGIKRVVYIEPYPKSKALDFHPDAITMPVDNNTVSNKVLFEPFVGVGPRCFFNLFSINLGTGYRVKRKNSEGNVLEWTRADGKLRMQMLPSSYIERESVSADIVAKQLTRLRK